MSSEEIQDTAAEDAVEQVLAERTWPVVITLASPVSLGSEHITSLEFRRGKLGDLKGLPTQAGGGLSLDQLMLLASRMCGKPLKVIESLSDDDAPAVLEIAAHFFARCLGAGKKRSR